MPENISLVLSVIALCMATVAVYFTISRKEIIPKSRKNPLGEESLSEKRKEAKEPLDEKPFSKVEVAEFVKECFDKIYESRRRSAIAPSLVQEKPNGEERISALEAAFNELKEQMKAITAMPAPAPATASVSPAPAPVKPKELWVSTFNDRYFMQVSEVKQEQSVFKITSNDGLKGTFELIELYKIKSRNDLQGFVRLTGFLSLEEAKAFDTTEVGECKLEKEGYWEVVKPLTINLQ